MNLAQRLRARQATRAAAAPAAEPAPPAMADLEAAWDAVWGGAAAAAEGEDEEDAAVDDTVVLGDGMLVGRVRKDELTVSDYTDALPQTVPDDVRAAATTLMELLMVYGASAEAAKAKVAELCSPPRVTKELRKVRSMNLAAGSTFDMVADSAGQAWDFRRADDRARAKRQISKEQTYLVIGSPPSTSSSRLSVNLNRGRVDAKEL